MISVPGHVGVIQWVDDRLWQAYRGTSEVPHVIACALMALEHWLLKMCKRGYIVGPAVEDTAGEPQRHDYRGGGKRVLRPSGPLRRGPPSLLKSDCIVLDRSRAEKEGDAPLGRYAATRREDRYYDERRESNALPHRRRDLESLANMLEPQNREACAPAGDDTGRAADSDADKDGTPTKDRRMPEEDPRTDAPLCMIGG